MGLILIETLIEAPAQRAFDAARDIGLHVETQQEAREVAIAGVTSGLIGMGEGVTFEACHFGLRLRHSSKITAFDPPHRFVDAMTRGAFSSFVHEHTFSARGSATLMTDRVELRAPLWILGRFVEWLFLDRYMERLLQRRALELKAYCESQEA